MRSRAQTIAIILSKYKKSQKHPGTKTYPLWSGARGGSWHRDPAYKFTIDDKINPDYYFLKVHHSGKMIGHVAFAKFAAPNKFHDVPRAAIDKEHRGKGLYQEMLRRAAAHVAIKHKGSKGVRSQAYQQSPDANRVWKKIARGVGDKDFRGRSDEYQLDATIPVSR